MTVAGDDVEAVSFGYADSGALEGLAGTTIKNPDADVDVQTDAVVDDNNLDYDFGYTLPGSLGDRVWWDVDGDGVQDPDEPGIAGVTVTLFDPDTGLTRSATTDTGGFYLFDNLRPDAAYVVAADDGTLPLSLDTQTFDLDGALDDQTTVGLDFAENRTDVDFGYTGSLLVGDTVFIDLDANGLQDQPGEVGIPGVVVLLLDGGGNVIGSTLTDGNGEYSFGVVSGTYSVRVADENFAAATSGAVGDRVWLDADGDNVQDSGEPGIANV